MKSEYSFRITEQQHKEIYAHLFPGDQKEAVMLAMCGRANAEAEYIFCVHKIMPIRYDDCSERARDQVTWSIQPYMPFLEEAVKKNLSVLKIHSHPKESFEFSEQDDLSDQSLFNDVYDIGSQEGPHLSAVMRHDGRLNMRIIAKDRVFFRISKISVIGDEILIYDECKSDSDIPPQSVRNRQVFGDQTVRLLERLKIGIVGCSGTGCWVVEQLARLGVGKLVLVDPKNVDHKNLNRVINTTKAHAESGTSKVSVLKDAVECMGFSKNVLAFNKTLFEQDVWSELRQCDVIFGCMDSYDGRDFLNRISVFYTIPYFDLGVRLEADGVGGIDSISGSVHYLIPGGSSLLSRGVYTPDQVRAAHLYRSDPDEYRKLKGEGYIKGANVDSPAVVSVNGFCSVLAINNFLSRLHPFRYESNSKIRHQCFDLINDDLINYKDDGIPCQQLAKYLGRGDMAPFVNCVL